MKLVLSGYYGFDNVGDEAILLSIITALRKEDPQVEITVLSNNPEKTAVLYGVDAVNRWKLKDVMRVIRASDGLISGGGSLLQDKTGNRSVIYYSGIMWIAKLLGKPYYVYAQGIGPLLGKRSQKIAKKTLEGSTLLTVRDEESKQLLRQIGVKKEAELVPDPVLGFELGEIEIPHITKKPYIAVSVRDWPSEYDFKKEVALACDQLTHAGYEIVFIPMHGEHDEKASREVVDQMEMPASIAPHDGTIKEKVKWITDSKLLIGMRLHALIFAAVGDTPYVALSYDPKIDSFAKLCHQPVAAHVNHEWKASELVEAAEGQLKDLDGAVARMLQYTKEAKIEATRTAKRIVHS